MKNLALHVKPIVAAGAIALLLTGCNTADRRAADTEGTDEGVWFGAPQHQHQGDVDIDVTATDDGEARDEAINQRIVSSIESDETLAQHSINARTVYGVAWLTGTVESEEERERAEELAKSHGAEEVVNHIRVSTDVQYGAAGDRQDDQATGAVGETGEAGAVGEVGVGETEDRQFGAAEARTEQHETRTEEYGVRSEEHEVRTEEEDVRTEERDFRTEEEDDLRTEDQDGLRQEDDLAGDRAGEQDGIQYGAPADRADEDADQAEGDLDDDRQDDREIGQDGDRMEY